MTCDAVRVPGDRMQLRTGALCVDAWVDECVWSLQVTVVLSLGSSFFSEARTGTSRIVRGN